MSAVRDYLLTVEKDKQDAKRIAESTATSTSCVHAFMR